MKRWLERLCWVALGVVAGIFLGSVYYLRLAEIETTAKSINEIVQAIAIVVAGFWTYWLFIAQRSHKKMVVINHKVEFVQPELSKLIVRAMVSVKNNGRVLLIPRLLKITIHQILPIKGDLPSNFPTSAPDEAWPELQTIEINCAEDEVTLEPDETQKFYVDFLVDLPLTCLQLASELYSLGEENKVGEKAGVSAAELGELEDITIWDEITLHKVMVSDIAKDENL